MKENREKKTDRLHIKIAPTLKESAIERADELGRSLSNYVEWLITEDLKKHQR